MAENFGFSYSNVGLPGVESSDYVPSVRYGRHKSNGTPTREPTLTPIDEPIPPDTTLVGPVYLLTPEDVERQERLENPWAIHGEDCIAQEIQNECEDTHRVLYPVYVECDDFSSGQPFGIVGKMQEFVDELVPSGPSECTFYFSGGRSIHCHVPRFVIGEEARENLKAKAAWFNERLSADSTVDFNFDTQVYSRKRQFRLPGVVHEKYELKKVEIQPDWDRDRVIKESAKGTAVAPETYAKFLDSTFAVSQVNDPLAAISVDGTNSVVQTAQSIGGDWSVLPLEAPQDELGSEIPVSLIEQQTEPTDPGARDLWNQYNGKEFSPYALAGMGGQSVCLFTVKGGPFYRGTKENGTTLVPSFVHAAVGCNGVFTMAARYAPVQLSSRDYDKRDWGGDETFVIIGGRSRSSRIIKVDGLMTAQLTSKLTDSESPRREALELLKCEGYDVGKGPLTSVVGVENGEPEASGGTSIESNSSWTVPKVNANRVLPADSPTTEAGQLQQRAEQGDIERDLGHTERANVANRLLSKYGWDPTWSWFQEQYGNRFDPEITYLNLKLMVEGYSDLAHIQIPPPP